MRGGAKAARRFRARRFLAWAALSLRSARRRALRRALRRLCLIHFLYGRPAKPCFMTGKGADGRLRRFRRAGCEKNVAAGFCAGLAAAREFMDDFKTPINKKYFCRGGFGRRGAAVSGGAARLFPRGAARRFWAVRLFWAWAAVLGVGGGFVRARIINFSLI